MKTCSRSGLTLIFTIIACSLILSSSSAFSISNDVILGSKSIKYVTITGNLYHGPILERAAHGPEPATILLLGISLIGLARIGRKRLIKKKLMDRNSFPDNGGRRSRIDRRRFSYTWYHPELRSGVERRLGINRRQFSYTWYLPERRLGEEI